MKIKELIAELGQLDPDAVVSKATADALVRHLEAAVADRDAFWVLGVMDLDDTHRDRFAHALQEGPPLRLTRATASKRTRLHAYDPRTKAIAYLIDLSGYMHEVWQVLDALQRALSQHPYLTQAPRRKMDEELAELYAATLDCIAVAAQYVEYLNVCRIGVEYRP